MGTIAPIIQQFDSTNSIRGLSGLHKKPATDKDQDIILKYLIQNSIFSSPSSCKRKHNTFPNPRNVLVAQDRDKLLTWMMEKLL